MLSKFPLAILAIFLFSSACDDKDNSSITQIKSVKLLQMSSETSKNEREISGVIAAAQNSEISFRVSGQIKEIKVKEGDKVTQGDILASLAPEEFASSYKSAKANYDSSLANLTAAEQNLQRQRNLYKQKLISTAEMENAEKSYASAKSSNEIAKENLNSSQQDLNDANLRAPFSGVVATINSENFTEIMAGAPILTLQGNENFEAHILIPETLINKVKINDKASVEIISLDKLKLAGTITEISAKASEGNAYQAVITLADNNAALVSGMTAITYLEYSYNEEENIFLLPTTAIDLRYLPQNSDQYNPNVPVYVYKPNADNHNIGKLELREIVINDLRNNMLEVRAGLKEGEFVVIAGVSYLSDGQIVKIWQKKYQRPINEDL